MQKESHFKEGSLLLESDLKGLEINKVVDNCLEILLLVYRLSKVHSLDAAYIENLKEKLVNEILVWSSRLSTFKEYDEKDIIKLRYCLCVFIDESLMKNDLFINSSWANHTLTVRLFDETLGGDNFYDIALSWLSNPSKNKDFLEFIYVCLILGYRGKYSHEKDVEEKIIYLCNNIASALTPLINLTDETAFDKAYNGANRENFWQYFQRRFMKFALVIIPIGCILGFFIFAIFDLQTHNIKIDSNISSLIKNIEKI